MHRQYHDYNGVHVYLRSNRTSLDVWRGGDQNLNDVIYKGPLFFLSVEIRAEGVSQTKGAFSKTWYIASVTIFFFKSRKIQ